MSAPDAMPALRSTWRERLPVALREPRLLRATLSHAAARLRLPGVAGVALAVLAIGMALASAWIVTPRIEAQARHIDGLRAELRRDSVARPAERADPAQLLAALPPIEQAPLFAQALNDGAKVAGVEIERTEYRTPETGDAQVARLQVIVPARADYEQLKRWLTRTLAEYPSCAIDELNLQRSARDTATPGGSLQARVVLSFYMRSAP